MADRFITGSSNWQQISLGPVPPLERCTPAGRTLVTLVRQLEECSRWKRQLARRYPFPQDLRRALRWEIEYLAAEDWGSWLDVVLWYRPATPGAQEWAEQVASTLPASWEP